MGAGASRPRQIPQPNVNDQTTYKEETKELKSLLLEARQIVSSLKEVEETKYNMCVLCCENPIDTILDPCGHYSLCETCAFHVLEKQGHCPMCRTFITKTMRVFLTSDDDPKHKVPAICESKGLQTTLPRVVDVSDFRKTI